MNRLAKLWYNPAVIEKAKGALTSILRKSVNCHLDFDDLRIMISETPLTLRSLAVIRANNEDRTEFIAIGITDDKSKSALEKLVNGPSRTAVWDEVSGFEKKLALELGQAIGPALIQAMIAANLKSLIYQTDAGLLGWRSIEFKRSLTILVSSEYGEFTLHIPVIEDVERDEISYKSIGFHEKARILIVDDSPVTRGFSRSVLASYGFLNVIECVDGVEAISRLNEPGLKIDLVIADWHMPKMNGLQLLQLIKTSDQFKSVPVLMVTGEQNKPEIIKAIKQGVSGYVVKPHEPLVLMTAIQKIGHALTHPNRKTG